MFIVPVQFLYADEQIWGTDVMEFDPRRWIVVDDKGSERLKDDTDQIGFLPWLTGPRVCPGKKFSQVEFVAGLASILATFRIKPVAKSGETEEEARARLKWAMDNAEYYMTPKIGRPETYGIRFVRIEQ
jgi:cytochrome P450